VRVVHLTVYPASWKALMTAANSFFIDNNAATLRCSRQQEFSVSLRSRVLRNDVLDRPGLPQAILLTPNITSGDLPLRPCVW